jgi:NTP pyrophosphatase (non-canonical NTP hydrolase)
MTMTENITKSVTDTVDKIAAKSELDKVAATARAKLECDLSYRLPTSGRALTNIVITRKQAEEILKELRALPLTFDAYQKAASTTAVAYPGRDSLLGLIYLTAKLNTEAAEAAQKALKAWRDGTAADPAAIASEIGDVLWYCAETASKLGFDLSEIAAANLTKLADRQKRGVIAGSGDNR